METINSLDNKKVINWAKLNQKKYRDQAGLFLIEGDHLIKEAIKGNNLKEIITTKDICYDKDIPHYLVPEQVIKKISNQISLPSVIGICNKISEKDLTAKVLVLDNIQDPGNLGTIIRSALAFGFNTILLSNDSVDLYNDKVIRATEGTIFNINVIRCDLISKIKDLKMNNYLVLATSLNGSCKKVDVASKLAIVIGNEGLGIKKEIIDLCDENIKINISSNVESLNASVAASILMYLYGDYYE